MSLKQNKKRIDELLQELKELQALPRSDWHAGFDALLRIDMHKFGDRVQIQAETEIGTFPPRTDYLILVLDEGVTFDKAIYQMFRRINILEYKNPRDSLDERVIRKVCGYANLYIGTAPHKEDRPSDQVTISIFRAKKNVTLFREMMREGKLIKDEVPGIYHVSGIVDLPFQIIITDELEGDEYAAYRALTKNAKEKDVEYVMDQVKQEADENVREHYGTLMKLISDKNPELMRKLEGDKQMGDVLMEILKDRIDEKIQVAVEEAKAENQAEIEEWKAKDKERKAEIEEWKAKDKEWKAKDKEWKAKDKEWKAKYRALEAENQKLIKENKERASYIDNLVKSISMGTDEENDPAKNSKG